MNKFEYSAFMVGWTILLAMLLLVASCHYTPANAFTLDEWANAIHKAEGNDNYGILKHYKHTTPRQACKNTIWHSWIRFCRINRNSPLKTLSAIDFTRYLGGTYCPIGVLNDPTGLNKNWIRNVSYFLKED